MTVTLERFCWLVRTGDFPFYRSEETKMHSRGERGDTDFFSFRIAERQISRLLSSPLNEFLNKISSSLIDHRIKSGQIRPVPSSSNLSSPFYISSANYTSSHPQVFLITSSIHSSSKTGRMKQKKSHSAFHIPTDN